MAANVRDRIIAAGDAAFRAHIGGVDAWAPSLLAAAREALLIIRNQIEASSKETSDRGDYAEGCDRAYEDALWIISAAIGSLYEKNKT